MAGLVALAPVPAAALNLGGFEVTSALDEPLRAEIKLQSVDAGTLESLEVTLGTRQDFQRADVPRSEFLQRLKFEVQGEGSDAVVVVSTDQPVKEPFLHFLIAAEWSGGKLVREYTGLLDPPLYADEAPSTVEAPSVAQQDESMEAMDSQAAAGTGSTGSGRVVTGGAAEYGPTQQGDTLWDIASRLDTGAVQANVFQVMIALQRQNPDAFIDNNINQLKTGQVLRLDDLASLADISAQEAQVAYTTQLDEWQAAQGQVAEAGEPAEAGEGAAETADAEAGVEDAEGAEAGPGDEAAGEDVAEAGQAAGEEEDVLRIVKSTVAGADGSEATGSGSSGSQTAGSDEDGSGEVGALRSQVATLQESLESRKLENQELRERVRLLEDQLQNAQRLVEIENQEMAAAQAQAGDTQESAGQAAEDDAANEQTTGQAAAEDPAAEPAMDDETAEGQATEQTMGDELAEGQAAAEQTAQDVADAGETAVDQVAEAGETAAEEVAEAGTSAAETAEEMAATATGEDQGGQMDEPAAASPGSQQGSGSDPSGGGGQPEGQPADEGGQQTAASDGGEATQVNQSAESTASAQETAGSASTTPARSSGAWWSQFTDMLFSSWLWMVAAALGVLVLVLGLLMFMRRRQSIAEFEESILSGSALDNSSDSTDNAATSASDTSFLSDFGTAGMGTMQANEVDPLAEAEVYLAYGRDEQAEDVLKEAARRDPERAEVKLKLLEIYKQRNDVKSFETISEELYPAGDRGNAAVWSQVAAMGRELSPANPLFHEESAPPDTAAGTAPTGGEDLGQSTAAAGDTGGGGMDMNFDELAREAGDEQQPASAADFRATDPQDDAASEGEAAQASHTPAHGEHSLDFDEEFIEQSSRDVDPSMQPFPAPDQQPELDRELERLAGEREKPAAGSAPDTPASIHNASQDIGYGQAETGDDSTLDFSTTDTSEIEFDLNLDDSSIQRISGADAAQGDTGGSGDQTPDLDDGGLQLDSDAFASPQSWTDTDHSSGTAPAQSQSDGEAADASSSEGWTGNVAAAASAGSDQGVDYSPFDDLDTNGDSTPGEADTKLDLARAYIDMGDKVGARSIIDEVMREGDPSQRDQASQLAGQL